MTSLNLTQETKAIIGVGGTVIAGVGGIVITVGLALAGLIFTLHTWVRSDISILADRINDLSDRVSKIEGALGVAATSPAEDEEERSDD